MRQLSLPLAGAVLLGLYACAPTPAAPPPASPAPPPAPPATAPALPGRATLSARFLDVGQGDATLVTTSDGASMLVDAGPPEAAPKVAAALDRIGRSVDVVVLSHAHADHLGALDALAAGPLQIRGFFLDSAFAEHPVKVYPRAIEALRGRAVAIRVARRGDAFAVGHSAEAHVLAPADPLLRSTRSDVNANSVVVRVDHRSGADATRLLFVGDAEEPTEKRLLEHASELRTDVLKVAHHGSKHASTAAFLDAAAPKIAVISCARGNDYGHPHKPALDRLSARGVAIYRTDLHGDVEVRSAGPGAGGLSVHTEREPDAAAIRQPGSRTERDAP
ncbi:MAG: MBL fold metallo-hydrolase [Myxococcales bacterium]|nr:MBL fold metallo-hydrolase [Myxococcales bacterium]